LSSDYVFVKSVLRVYFYVNGLFASIAFVLLAGLLLLSFAMKLAAPQHYLYFALANPQGTQADWIHVVRVGNDVYAVRMVTPDWRTALLFVGLDPSKATWVATFQLWPGGYSCTGAPGVGTRTFVKIGNDPYTGLWCPPPWQVQPPPPPDCVPRGATSRGRVMVVEYACAYSR